MERFFRTKLLIGETNLKRLQDSRVTVIGLGAVGSYAVESLARSGIGNFKLIDFDKVHKSNINRQLYALESTIGIPKTFLAQKRIYDINPKANVELSEEFAAAENISCLLKNKPDIIIDAIDSLNPKIQILTSIYHENIPVISSMGAAYRTNPFSIKAGELFNVSGCPLARIIRKRLRKQGIHNGIFCVYSDEHKPRKQFRYISSENDDEYKRGRERRSLGSLPTITGIFGLIIAHCAINYLCEGTMTSANFFGTLKNTID